MDKKIVIKNLDGTCGILTPAPNMFDSNSRDRENLRDRKIDFKTDKEVLDWIIKKDVNYYDVKTKKVIGNLHATEIYIKENPKAKIAQLEYRIINADKIPTDRTFRNAWTDDNATETVDVNMDKAKEIHLNNLRKIRQKKFADLGFPNRLNSEVEEKILSKETLKKLNDLRDFTKNLDLSSVETPDQLKAAIPDILK